MPSLEHDPDRTHRLPALDPGAAAAAAAAPLPDGASAAGTENELTGRLRAAEALCAHYLEALELRQGGRDVADDRLRALESELDAARRQALALERECEALKAARLDAPHAGAMPAATEPATYGGVRARDAEIDAEHSARLAAQRARRAAESRCAQQAVRIAELESLAESLGHALQVRTEAASRANAATETAEHTVDDLRRLVARLERQAREIPGAAPAPDHDRIEQLTLELAKTRGALEERDLQIRRLERNLARRQHAAPSAAEPTPAPAHGAGSLCPLNGSAPYAIAAGTRTRIGRATDNDVCVEDASVSRHHAVIVATSAGTFIEDLRSVNGVGVNGRRVRHARLAAGDVVTLGTLRFRFAPATAVAAEG